MRKTRRDHGRAFLRALERRNPVTCDSTLLHPSHAAVPSNGLREGRKNNCNFALLVMAGCNVSTNPARKLERHDSTDSQGTAQLGGGRIWPPVEPFRRASGRWHPPRD